MFPPAPSANYSNLFLCMMIFPTFSFVQLHNHKLPLMTFYLCTSSNNIFISKQKVIINNGHPRGHTDARCRAKFDPKKNKEAKHFNTQVAEQTFSWFGKFKHIGRHMGLESYWVFIIGLFHERNKVCIARQKARNKRKRKRSNDFE